MKQIKNEEMISNNFRFRTLGAFLLLASFFFSSCKKDNSNAIDIDPDVEDEGGGTGKIDRGLRMLVDGKAWEANWYFTLTGTLEDDEDDEDMLYANDYHTLVLMGMQLEGFDSEVDFEDIYKIGLTLIAPIHKSNFNNPKGKYPIGIPSEKSLTAVCLYFDNPESDEGYMSADDKNLSRAMGELTIDEFEIGNVTLFGIPTGEKGYTRIAGTFSVDLNKYDLSDYNEDQDLSMELIVSLARLDGSIKITNGSFNVRNDDILKDISGFYKNRLQQKPPYMFKNIIN